MSLLDEYQERFRSVFVDTRSFNNFIRGLKVFVDDSEDNIREFIDKFWSRVENNDESPATIMMEYREHRMAHLDMSYDKFISIYNKNKTEAVEKLFLAPNTRAYMRIYEGKLKELDSAEYLYKLHKINPYALHRYLKSNNTLKEQYENELEKQKERNTWEHNEYSVDNDIDEDAINNIPKNNLRSQKITLQRLVRDSKESKKLKRYYNGTCQLCNTQLKTVDGYISEAHHIRPYNKTHKGDDTIKNLIVLCPNCHARFDDLYYAINPKTLLVHCFDKDDPYHLKSINIKERHEFGKEYLEYTWNLFLGK
jgi:predicted restriction endonuclease